MLGRAGRSRRERGTATAGLRGILAQPAAAAAAAALSAVLAAWRLRLASAMRAQLMMPRAPICAARSAVRAMLIIRPLAAISQPGMLMIRGYDRARTAVPKF
eukprot:SAG31_NODE_7030_length_1811_cov_1.239486_1_plen_102_part_00